MTFEQRKAVVLSFWILMVAAAGLALAVTTPAGWGLIVAIAIIPSIIVMRMWTPPLAAIAQPVHGGRR